LTPDRPAHRLGTLTYRDVLERDQYGRGFWLVGDRHGATRGENPTGLQISGGNQMNKTDRELGMDRDISRRDLMVGAAAVGAVAAAGTGLPGAALAQTPAQPMWQDMPGYYPPTRTGLRGSHPGSFEAGHAIRDGSVLDAGEDTGEQYDLVVVGAGMSGLAAAYYFKKRMPKARILILDNHDDFGGHARRNEAMVGGRKVIGYGGTMYILSPEAFTFEGRELLRDVGIDTERFLASAGPRSLAPVFNLNPGVIFDRETYGVDRLVVGQPPRPARGETGSIEAWRTFLGKTPLSRGAREGLLRLNTERVDYMAGLSVDDKIARLRKMSYTDYLLNVVKVHPDVIPFIRKGTHGGMNAVAGLDTASAYLAFEGNRAGFDGLGLPQPRLRRWMPEADGKDLHFPDGNHGLARLIVRWLIPDALPGSTQEDSVTRQVDYAMLDRPTNDVRLRLSSTVGRVRHDGSPSRSQAAEVVYLRGGKAYRVKAASVVMACNNAIIPHIAPEVPEPQKVALKNAVRMPLVYGTVVVRNWRPFQQLGVANMSCPGSGFWWDSVGLDWATTLGDYHAARTPDDPMPLHLTKVPSMPGLSAKDQFRAGRAELEATSFETIERATRRMLQVALGPGGFDAARDIEAIFVNRHPHGYANCANELYDPDWAPEERPWVVGRQRVGRIAIANSDAGAICLTQCAFDQAHRAVTELIADVLQPLEQFPWGVEN
jgi:spermidine dehydrogenase